MPELTPQSTPPEEAAVPPIIDPATFEDFPTLRETYLLYVTDLEANAALRAVATLLYDLTLEYWHYWPDHPEGFIRAQLRAAVADMRHVQGFLSDLEKQGDGDSAHESHLCGIAGGVSRDLEELADRIEKELGRWRGEV
jgi:hypothetical protein